mgnify:CR=1 FL=1
MQEIGKDLYLIDKAELLQVIMEKKTALWRLCQICCSYPKAENHYEVTYSFANGYEIANFRLIAEKEEEIPSISRVYKAAIYYENNKEEEPQFKNKKIPNENAINHNRTNQHSIKWSRIYL